MTKIIGHNKKIEISTDLVDKKIIYPGKIKNYFIKKDIYISNYKLKKRLYFWNYIQQNDNQDLYELFCRGCSESVTELDLENCFDLIKKDLLNSMTLENILNYTNLKSDTEVFPFFASLIRICKLHKYFDFIKLKLKSQEYSKLLDYYVDFGTCITRLLHKGYPLNSVSLLLILLYNNLDIFKKYYKFNLEPKINILKIIVQDDYTLFHQKIWKILYKKISYFKI